MMVVHLFPRLTNPAVTALTVQRILQFPCIILEMVYLSLKFVHTDEASSTPFFEATKKQNTIL